MDFGELCMYVGETKADTALRKTDENTPGLVHWFARTLLAAMLPMDVGLDPMIDALLIGDVGDLALQLAVNN
eukprot:241631-Amphidinium_carterae.1